MFTWARFLEDRIHDGFCFALAQLVSQKFVFVIFVFFFSPVEWSSVHISWLYYIFWDMKQRYWGWNTSPFPLLAKQTKVSQIKDFLNSEGTLFASAKKCWKISCCGSVLTCPVSPLPMKCWAETVPEMCKQRQSISDSSTVIVCITQEFPKAAEK